jgi:hypothetical protein
MKPLTFPDYFWDGMKSWMRDLVLELEEYHGMVFPCGSRYIIPGIQSGWWDMYVLGSSFWEVSTPDDPLYNAANRWQVNTVKRGLPQIIEYKRTPLGSVGMVVYNFLGMEREFEKFRDLTDLCASVQGPKYKPARDRVFKKAFEPPTPQPWHPGTWDPDDRLYKKSTPAWDDKAFAEVMAEWDAMKKATMKKATPHIPPLTFADGMERMERRAKEQLERYEALRSRQVEVIASAATPDISWDVCPAKEGTE